MLCDVVCLQETKRETFDSAFIKNYCPTNLDEFEFLPSVGASGGILVAWKSLVFSGRKVFSNAFALSVQFYSRHDNSTWLLTVVYGPCTPEGKTSFLNWFKNIQMSANFDWLVL